jgi:hypothetical protein
MELQGFLHEHRFTDHTAAVLLLSKLMDYTEILDESRRPRQAPIDHDRVGCLPQRASAGDLPATKAEEAAGLQDILLS